MSRTLALGLVLFGIDYLICVTHNLRFVREFLPTKEHRRKLGMAAGPSRVSASAGR